MNASGMTTRRAQEPLAATMPIDALVEMTRSASLALTHLRLTRPDSEF